MGIGRVELDQLLLRVWGIIDLGVWHALREHSLREDRVRNHKNSPTAENKSHVVAPGSQNNQKSSF